MLSWLKEVRAFVRAFGFIFILAAIATGSFYASDTFFSQISPARAGPSSQPEEPSAALEAGNGPRNAVPRTAVPFTGRLNGFTFYDPARMDHDWFLQQWSPDCRALGEASNIRHLSEDYAETSRLNFTVAPLPAGAQRTTVTVSACEWDVFAISRDYQLPGAQVQVNRKTRPPFVLASAPRDRMEAATIGGRPAVIVLPDHTKGRTAIHLRDGFSLWSVHCFQVELSACIKVAEGVRSST